MKVRVTYTVNVSDEIRAGINSHYARPGMATREQVKQWFTDHGIESLLDLSPYHYFDDEDD